MLRLKELNGLETPPGKLIRARQGSIINGLEAPPQLDMITGLHIKVPLGLYRCRFAQHQCQYRSSYSGYF